jgi:hydroxypyruvate isomerase
MPRFSDNLSLRFADLPFLDRLAAAATHGVRAVEVTFAYGHPVR